MKFHGDDLPTLNIRNGIKTIILSLSILNSSNSIVDFRKVFVALSKVGLNIRARDRIIKFIQYGCQMVLSYYKSILPAETVTSLSTLRRACSNSRKVFWFLKSFNHFAEMLKNKHVLISKSTLVEKIDFFEQIFLAIYFYYENKILFARMNLFGLDESRLDPYCNWAWFIGDVAYFFSTSIRLISNISKTSSVESVLKVTLDRTVEKMSGGRNNINDSVIVDNVLATSTNTLLDAEEESVTASLSSTATSRGCVDDIPLLLPSEESTVEEGMDQKKIISELLSLSTDRTNLIINFLVASFELGVSAHYVGFYRQLFGGQNLLDGHVGLMGALSSVLTVSDAYRKSY